MTKMLLKCFLRAFIYLFIKGENNVRKFTEKSSKYIDSI